MARYALEMAIQYHAAQVQCVKGVPLSRPVVLGVRIP